MSIHLLTPSGLETACGIVRHQHGHLTHTIQKIAVTCADCQESEEFKRAIQRLPKPAWEPYRG